MQSVAYVDSSVLVLVALDDPRLSRRQRELIQASDSIVSSEIAVVECQAGISMQLATPKSRPLMAAAEQNLNRVLAASDLIAVDSQVLGRARALVKSHRAAIGLRSLDAIHVATAGMVAQSLEGQADLRFFTADRRQFEAFTAEGLVGDLIA